MRLKNVIFSMFLFIMMHVGVAYAKDVKFYVDTVALEAALDQITVIGDYERDEDKVASAKADLYLYFMENSSKSISTRQIATKCKKIIKNKVSCMNFIKTYNSYLNDANACFEANTLEVKANTSYGWQKYSIQDCRSIVSGTSVDPYESYDVTEKCKILVDKVDRCVMYMKNFYIQKRSEVYSYNCEIRRLNNGEFDMPISQARLAYLCKWAISD
jgi:hypothetical protein